ncbi:MAG: DMT family transporter [Lachnospiraceae bacterium]|nr:DMT family transporter [Lachnospiraceae bacterium]
MKKWLGTGLLLLTALIWGLAFVAQSAGMDYVGPFTFNGVRYLIGGCVLIPFVISGRLKYRKTEGYLPEKEKEKNKYSLVGGFLCGLFLCTASILQQFGILFTNQVGKAGFLTALYIVFVPVLGLFFKKKNRISIWIAVGIALIGLYLLCVKDGFSIEKGDVLLFLCSIVFSGHIMVIDYYADKTFGVELSCIQFFVSGIICSILMLVFEKPVLADILRAYISILYAGVLSCGVAYTLQIVGQKYVEPAKASLILCLESVFSLLGGMIILDQMLLPKEWVGCIIVFAAILIAQIGENKKEKSAL